MQTSNGQKALFLNAAGVKAVVVFECLWLKLQPHEEEKSFTILSSEDQTRKRQEQLLNLPVQQMPSETSSLSTSSAESFRINLRLNGSQAIRCLLI